jgi:hypothetical protein
MDWRHTLRNAWSNQQTPGNFGIVADTVVLLVHGE